MENTKNTIPNQLTQISNELYNIKVHSYNQNYVNTSINVIREKLELIISIINSEVKFDFQLIYEEMIRLYKEDKTIDGFDVRFIIKEHHDNKFAKMIYKQFKLKKNEN